MSRTEWIILAAIATLVAVMVGAEPDHAVMPMNQPATMAMDAGPGDSVVRLSVSGMT